MPIGRAPQYDRGPMDFEGERFLRWQRVKDWKVGLWQRSWGIQVYTGMPSERDGAQWHDIDFKYDAICAAPDNVFKKRALASVYELARKCLGEFWQCCTKRIRNQKRILLSCRTDPRNDAALYFL